MLKMNDKYVLIGNYKFPRSEYDEFMNEYGDIKDEIDGYLEALDNLYNNGGTIYRILFIPKGQEPNIKSIGIHWTLDQMSAENYADTHFNESGDHGDVEEQDHDKFMVTGSIPSGIVNVKESINETIIERNYDEAEAYIPEQSTYLINILSVDLLG